jgi:hypothetical protein
MRDFWFQVFLCLAGVAMGVAATLSDDFFRRIWWSLAILSWTLAGLSWVWGDPVRGPFYGLNHPKAKTFFTLHAGSSSIYPLSQLSDGVDMTGFVFPKGMEPIRLRVQRRWWSGWSYSVALRTTASGLETEPSDRWIRFTEKGVESLPSGWDLNADDYAVEVVRDDKASHVVFQLIQSSDYDIYVNAIMELGEGLDDAER